MKLMRNFFMVIVVILSVDCSNQKQPIGGNSDFQRTLNAEFKDASKSPLKKNDRKDFDGLEFFEISNDYVVQATLTQTPNEEWFNMKTTTDRVSKERVYGILTFTLQGREFKLNVYQGQEMMETAGFEDYLFLPFLDDTNGDSTYGGGRYIDLRIPESDSILIDFNTAYNPYCAYNEKYSCPIVPRVNYLSVKIEAGVKAFRK